MSYRRDNYERHPLPGSGYLEDFTGPFLVVAGVLCFIALFVLWSLFGLPFALVVAFFTDRVLARKLR